VAYIFFYLHVYYEPMQGTCGQKKTTKKNVRLEQTSKVFIHFLCLFLVMTSRRKQVQRFYDIPEFPGELSVIYWEHFFSRWAIDVFNWEVSRKSPEITRNFPVSFQRQISDVGKMTYGNIRD